MVYRLIMLSGPMQGQRLSVERQPMTVGRGADCALVIPDEEMALQHAVLEHRVDGLYVRDLGAMGRILVNGREVHEQRLRHGDEVEMGRTRFLVQALVRADVSRARRRASWREAGRLAGAFVVLALTAWYGVAKWREMREILHPPASPPARPALAADSTNSWSVKTREELWQEIQSDLSITGASPAELILPLPVSVVDTQMEEEIRVMREDLTNLRARLHELIAGQNAATNRPAVAATEVVAVAAAPALSQDPILRDKAGAMMRTVREKVSAGELAEADRILDGVQSLLPEYVAAYEERARLFEQRAMPERAMEQWLQVIDRAPDAQTRAVAVREFQRLDQSVPEPAPQPEPSDAGGVRIARVEHRKFHETAEFSEMRVVDVALIATPSNRAVRVEGARLEVHFFDEEPGSGRIVPSRALVSVTPPAAGQIWAPGEVRVATAAYVVPKAASGDAPRPRFYGYTVKVFCNGVLQDEDARPRSLRGMALAGGGGR